MVEDARIVFGKRAKWYRNSPEHSDHQVGGFDEGLKGKFGYRTVSAEAHIKHWFVMLTAVKKISSSY